MSILEEKSFIKAITPFNRLDEFHLEKLVSSLDIVYFKENEKILTIKEKPQYLFFIIKGVVQEKDENSEIVSVYSYNEYFDPISLIENTIKHNFITTCETICYALPRALFLEIMYQNEELESFFFQSISKKLNSNIENEQSKEFVNFMISRVKDTYLQKVLILDANTTIFQAVESMKKNNSSSLLIKDIDNKLAIVTDTDFREKVILNRIDFDEPISKIATYDLQYVNSEEFLFNAQLKMNNYGIKRLIVKDEKSDEIIGILDLLSLTSFFASHTYLVMSKLDNANSIEDLKRASKSFVKVIRVLFAKGVKVRYISKLISQLNNKLFSKLFNLLVPLELKSQFALIIMGSEGRSEQILRTDQDNALILNDNCKISKEDILKFTTQFTEHLISFGYPACEGNIMISNPFWVKTVSEFKNMIFDTVHNPNEEKLMNLAIFFDSICVSGDKELLTNIKEYIHTISTNTQSFYIHFAKPSLNFETPLSMFSKFIVDKKQHKDELDIKKGGIFAIVHGVRTLSLEYDIKDTNTVERLKELNNKNIIDREFTSEIIESFTFLLSLRLKFRLQKIDAKLELDNYINPNKLNTLEKDLLRDSFKIVDKFKKFLTYHYKLNMIG